MGIGRMVVCRFVNNLRGIMIRRSLDVLYLGLGFVDHLLGLFDGSFDLLGRVMLPVGFIGRVILFFSKGDSVLSDFVQVVIDISETDSLSRVVEPVFEDSFHEMFVFGIIIGLIESFQEVI